MSLALWVLRPYLVLLGNKILPSTPCLRNTTSFIPRRYWKSHGRSNYTTLRDSSDQLRLRSPTFYIYIYIHIYIYIYIYILLAFFSCMFYFKCDNQKRIKNRDPFNFDDILFKFGLKTAETSYAFHDEKENGTISECRSWIFL